MPVYHTVVPIHGVTLDPATRVELAGGVAIGPIPPWVRKDKMLEALSEWDRKALEECSHALITTYEAAALGDPDPAWTGSEPKSIQESKYELCLLANLALWLSRPSPVHFTVVVHAPQFGPDPIAQRISRHSPLLCHPRDVDNRVTATDLDLAARLHGALAAVAREGAIWTAVRATWAGLQMNIEAIRYALFWMALEALFGPEDSREITYRLAQRVAFFLGKDRAEAKQLFATTKRGYGFRSKIVHGRWKEETDSEERMAETEELVRRSFSRLLPDDDLKKTFSSKAREAYLDELVF
jgi:hypothetical protein